MPRDESVCRKNKKTLNLNLDFLGNNRDILVYNFVWFVERYFWGSTHGLTTRPYYTFDIKKILYTHRNLNYKNGQNIQGSGGRGGDL